MFASMTLHTSVLWDYSPGLKLRFIVSSEKIVHIYTDYAQMTIPQGWPAEVENHKTSIVRIGVRVNIFGTFMRMRCNCGVCVLTDNACWFFSGWVVYLWLNHELRAISSWTAAYTFRGQRIHPPWRNDWWLKRSTERELLVSESCNFCMFHISLSFWFLSSIIRALHLPNSCCFPSLTTGKFCNSIVLIPVRFVGARRAMPI